MHCFRKKEYSSCYCKIEMFDEKLVEKRASARACVCVCVKKKRERELDFAVKKYSNLKITKLQYFMLIKCDHVLKYFVHHNYIY